MTIEEKQIKFQKVAHQYGSLRKQLIKGSKVLCTHDVDSHPSIRTNCLDFINGKTYSADEANLIFDEFGVGHTCDVSLFTQYFKEI